MTAKAVLTFIDTVLQHYPPFRWEEEQQKAWVGTMVRELSGFSDAVLDRAIREMVRTRKDRRIPLVPECLDACSEARRWLDAEKGKGQLSAGAAPVGSGPMDWNEDAFKFSRDVMSGPMGLQAAKEGWIGCLDAYIRRNRRAPSAGEIPALKRQAMEFDETYAMCIRGGIHDVARWVGLGEDILQRRNKLIDWRLSLR